MADEKHDPTVSVPKRPATPPASLPLRNNAPPIMPSRQTVPPEIVRRPREYAGTDEHRVSNYSGASDGKRLLVGREIALSGQISACDKLVVEGRVEANMSECREIEVAESGTFKGEAEIDIAEIAGTFDGSITARELLIIRSTGRVSGTVRVGRLEVERGGEIDGNIQMLSTDA
jgi:cytoskeletal protein CcmA (bactofilin family)